MYFEFENISKNMRTVGYAEAAACSMLISGCAAAIAVKMAFEVLPRINLNFYNSLAAVCLGVGSIVIYAIHNDLAFLLFEMAKNNHYGKFVPPYFFIKGDVSREKGKLISSTAYVKKQTADGTWHEVAATAFFPFQLSFP